MAGIIGQIVTRQTDRTDSRATTSQASPNHKLTKPTRHNPRHIAPQILRKTAQTKPSSITVLTSSRTFHAGAKARPIDNQVVADFAVLAGGEGCAMFAALESGAGSAG